MRCPYCQHNESKVIDTTHDTRGGVRRRRECENCHQRFSTYERPILATPLLIKRDGTREEFDREKLERGIRISTSKRFARVGARGPCFPPTSIRSSSRRPRTTARLRSPTANVPSVGASSTRLLSGSAHIRSVGRAAVASAVGGLACATTPGGGGTRCNVPERAGRW